ncbi:hypothetical protein J8L85_16125 [Maribacter sp. MMG018]|uniref:hypothetical protein n=1 Tax=Maribacter sp. MMG018 TaxID=2822688 RepID=UPI001B35AFFF|nr:hypothetical protein [Maribacter sp. MMG018]MBQ4915982.1 hypothetical protein [Maribacter sp. MMG018]
MNKLKVIFTIISMLLFCPFLVLYAQSADVSDDYFLFGYFYGYERQNEGLHLAVSKDGLQWVSVKNDSSVFHPGFGAFFRDPMFKRDPKNPDLIHMVWSTGNNDSFGISSTYDLLNWFDTKEVRINKDVEGVYNTWAPELFWDEDTQQWMVYWGSSIQGKFVETSKLSPNPRANNRMYYSLSDDLENWSQPILLQDFGFPSVDCYIYKLPDNHPKGKYIEFVKHIVQPGKLAAIREAYSYSLTGPYVLTESYITGKYKFSEGPNLIKIGEYYYLYVDLSREHRMAVFRTKEIGMGKWEDLTDTASFPNEAKHGSIIRISKDMYDKLNK